MKTRFAAEKNEITKIKIHELLNFITLEKKFSLKEKEIFQ